MKHWLMLQGYTTLNTMYRKTPQEQTTFISPKGNEKQIDYILTKRRYLRQKKDAEANDIIHMGSGHRCVMATFTITTSGKNGHYKTIILLLMKREHGVRGEKKRKDKQTRGGPVKHTCPLQCQPLNQTSSVVSAPHIVPHKTNTA